MSDDESGAVSQAEIDALKQEVENTKDGFLKRLASESEKRHAAELQIAELKGKQDAQPVTQEHVYTRAELRRKVDDGSLNEDEMGEILERQTEKRLRQELKKELEGSVSANSERDNLQSEVDKYIQFKPDLMTEGSESRSAVAAEAQVQSRFTGQPVSSFVTQAAALRAIYGPADQLKAAVKPDPEPSQEGGGDDGDIESRGNGGIPKGLTAREAAHGQKLVEAGVYKSVQDYAKTVLKHGNPAIRQRHGAKV